MKKKVIVPISILGVFVLFFVGIYFVIRFQCSKVSSEQNAIELKIEIPYGEKTLNVAKKLQENHIIKNADLFYHSATKPNIFQFFYSDDLPKKFLLKSGTYTVNSSMSIPQILEVLSSGQTEYVKVSIPEGLTIKKIASILEENRICSADDFIKICNGTILAQSYNIPFYSVEGYLFPDTYYLNLGMSAESVAKIMIDNFFEKIKQVPNLSEKNNKELNDIVILASIVEREYKLDEEAPLIASVFKNRISQNIGLYSCATIEYIITEIQGKPHPEQILISDTKIDSPYNTYKWAGLTPGPISNPGLVALNATINTPKTNYYFFQVNDEQKGNHIFTHTFEEHKENH